MSSMDTWWARRQEIEQAILHDGWLISDVAEYYRISHERARQIIRELGIPYSTAKVTRLWCPWPSAGPRFKPRGRWSVKYTACQQCGRTESPHYGHGLCAACYGRKRYANLTPEQWQQHDRVVRRWQAEHPDANRRIAYEAVKRFNQRKREADICLGSGCWQPAAAGHRYCESCLEVRRERYHARKQRAAA